MLITVIFIKISILFHYQPCGRNVQIMSRFVDNAVFQILYHFF